MTILASSKTYLLTSLSQMELDDRILKASIALFFTHGIKAVSMDDIAKSVGISKRTLYEHFVNKDALLMGCIDDMLQQRNQRMAQLLEESSSFIEVVMRSTYEAVSFAHNISGQFFEDLHNLNFSGARAQMDNTILSFRKRIEELIEKGKNDGLIRPEVNAEFIAFCITNGDSLNRIYKDPEAAKWPRAWILKQFTLLFLRGISTEKGLCIIDKFAPKLIAEEQSQQ